MQPFHLDKFLYAQSAYIVERKALNICATPKLIACGDCALNRGVFAEAYGVAGAVGEIIDVDVPIPGCPPAPDRIVAALRSVTHR